MEQATKFFSNFEEGFKEVLEISSEIKEWFKDIDVNSLNETEVRKYLLTLKNNYLIETERCFSYESENYLELTWSYWEDYNEYAFMIRGHHFDEDEELKDRFQNTEGWRIIEYR